MLLDIKIQASMLPPLLWEFKASEIKAASIVGWALALLRASGLLADATPCDRAFERHSDIANRHQ